VDHGDLRRRFTLTGNDCLVVVGSYRGKLAVDVIRDLLTVEPRARVIAVGKLPEADALTTVITAGARGFVRWDAISTRLLATLAQTATDHQPHVPIVQSRTGRDLALTEREMEVSRNAVARFP
jgi:DNA-binding NarL/FixJ family response regulator